MSDDPHPIEQLKAIDQAASETEAARVECRAIREAVPFFLPDGLIICRHDGEIVDINNSALHFFLYDDRAKVIGQKVEILLPPEARDGHPELRNTYNTSGFNAWPRLMASDRVVRGLRSNGETFECSVVLIPMEVGGKLYNLAQVRRLNVPTGEGG